MQKDPNLLTDVSLLPFLSSIKLKDKAIPVTGQGVP
jgi:hypothetical protein